MNRTEKSAIVSSLKECTSRASVLILADFRGMTVSKMEDFRRRCRRSQIRVQVVRNTLARRALGETLFSGLSDDLAGPTLLVWSETDPAAAAKVLSEFVREGEKLKIRSGMLSRMRLTVEELRDLAMMPSTERLRAMFLAALNAPMSSLLAVLDAPARQFLATIKAREEKTAATRATG